MRTKLIDALFGIKPSPALSEAPTGIVDALLAGTLFLDVEADRAGRPHAVGAVLGDRVFPGKGAARPRSPG